MGKEINTGSSVILHYRTYPLNYKKTLVCLLLLSVGKNNWKGILRIYLAGNEHILISHLSGQIMIFRQPIFPWNKRISLAKPPFKVRSCEVAIIWPDLWKKENHLRWSVGVLGYDSMGIPGIANWVFCMLQLSHQENGTRKTIIDLLEVSFFKVSMVSMDQISPQDRSWIHLFHLFPCIVPPEI